MAGGGGGVVVHVLDFEDQQLSITSNVAVSTYKKVVTCSFIVQYLHCRLNTLIPLLLWLPCMSTPRCP